MNTRSLVAVVLLLGLAADSTHASSIGLFFAPDASDCDGEAVPFVEFQTYVIALLTADVGTGMTGAEFRVDGVVPSWFNTVVPNPASNVTIGNPITGGCNIAFPQCQPGPNVLLYTIKSVSLEAIPPSTFVVRRHTTPSSPNWQCPLITQCNDFFQKVCVTGGTAYLNGGSCSVRVADTTWSSVKRLYER